MAISDYEQRILDNVNEHGWFCVSVLAGSDHEPPFSYSVGFIDSLKCSEFIVFGLSPNLMHSMLERVFRQIRDGMIVPEEENRWSNILEGYDCISRPVHLSQIKREYFNSALWYRSQAGLDRETMPARQLFWPGAGQRLFPWEKGCMQEVRDLQPLLYLPREVGLA